MLTMKPTKSAGAEDTSLIESHLDELKDNLEGHEDKLVRFLPSNFAAHAAAWEALEQRIGRPLPADLRCFYQTCDGFTDNRYTRIGGVDRLLVAVGRALDGAGDLKLASIGDGCGLDEKSIELVLGNAFDGGAPMFVFHDYRLDFDVDTLLGFRRRVLASTRAAFEARFPLWLGGNGKAVDDADEAELVHYGPATMTELIEYIIATAAQV